MTYPGLPSPKISTYLSREASKSHYSENTSFHIGQIELVANTSTYLDTPFHRYATGDDLSELSLEKLGHLNGARVRIPQNVTSIGPEWFDDLPQDIDAVLVQTGWDHNWGTKQYLAGHPFLTGETAEFLVSEDVKLVGIDSLNIDSTSDGKRPVHSTLLKAEVLIVEHLCNLDQLPDSGFQFFAVPIKIEKFGTFPVRAYATLSNE